MTPEELEKNEEVRSLRALLKSIDDEITRRQAIGNDTPGLASISRLFAQKASTVKALSKLKETLGYYQDGEQIAEAEREKLKMWEALVSAVCADDPECWRRYQEFLFAWGIDQPNAEDIRHAEQERKAPVAHAEWTAQQAGGDQGLLDHREARLKVLLADVVELQADIDGLKRAMQSVSA